MFYPTFQLKNPNGSNNYLQFQIVQVGAGGNGGYLTQRLSKLLANLKDTPFSYRIVDGDRVEPHNLTRQPFLEEDIHEPKAKVLAERYGTAYNIPILYVDEYIESPESITDLFYSDYLYHYYCYKIPILIGCVDNNATRQILHEAFEKLPTCIYIDSGIDSIDEEGSKKSGYSGQVVCGVKWRGDKILSPVGEIYSNILTDQDSRLPTQACGMTVVNHPQRMQTNETAALIMMGYLNTILCDYEIVSHYTNFNARTMLVRPTYIKELVSL